MKFSIIEHYVTTNNLRLRAKEKNIYSGYLIATIKIYSLINIAKRMNIKYKL